ncbi:MAG TPA: DUF819 family protein [Phnomibacter sp.]|nr:DUF819 family protein [Phnomibacter sp.]
MFEDPLYIGGMLCLLIMLSVWLARFRGFKMAGSPILVILICAIAANAGIIPTATGNLPIYNGVFTYIAPLSIFVLLLEVNLKSIRKAGGPLLLLFCIGALATVVGILFSWWVLQPAKSIGPLAPAIAGMYTGTYIGGSLNFNAVALHYGVSDRGELFAATTVVDNIIGTPWIMLALLLPRWLQRLWPARRSGAPSQNHNPPALKEQQVSVPSIALLGGMGLLAIFFSNMVNEWFPKIPSILILTTLALLIAQMPQVKNIKGVQTIGLFLTLLFLGVIGTLCDVPMLIRSGPMALALMGFVGLAILVHGIVLFGLAGLLKMDWDLAGMASLTNVGGSTTAIAGSEGLNRPDLLLPGILVGSLGNAAGTYIGFAVAGSLGA